MLWRLGLPLDALDEHADRPLSADEQSAVQVLIDQRIATRKPAAYLTGEAPLPDDDRDIRELQDGTVVGAFHDLHGGGEGGLHRAGRGVVAAFHLRVLHKGVQQVVQQLGRQLVGLQGHLQRAKHLGPAGAGIGACRQRCTT